MKKSCPSKELLIDWLRTALDYQLYRGLGWSDKEKEIFYVKWVHKSSEQWSGDDLEPFKAWAGHKGKLDGKNPKQLKATFRCALNSKKELKEHGQDRGRRYWKFVDPNTAEEDKAPKKRRKNCKAVKRSTDNAVTASSNKTIKNETCDGMFSSTISIKHESKVSKSPELTAYDCFSNFEPLTPPDQTTDHPYTCTDFKISKDYIDKLGKCSANFKNVDHIAAGISPIPSNNALLENNNEASTVLPPFETFGSFQILTPPPQKNEVNFIPSDNKTNYTPPPDQSRLTPPQKPYHTYRDTYNRPNTDIWQPNCWPIQQHHTEKQSTGLSDFFSSDFIGIYKSSNQEPENNNSMDFFDMDQYVPVMNTTTNIQIKTVQPTLVNRTPSSFPTHTDNMSEMNLYDFFLGDDVDPEECSRLMQEINRTSSLPQYRLQS